MYCCPSKDGCIVTAKTRQALPHQHFNPRKPIPKRLRWTRQRTRLIPGRAVFMWLNPNRPNIFSSALSPFPIRSQPQKRFEAGAGGAEPAKTSTPPCGLDALHQTEPAFLPEEGGQPGNAPRSASASGIWASCASNSGDHFLQTDPRATSRQHCPHTMPFSFAISFSFAAAHRPFGPCQHSHPKTIRQYTKLSVFRTKKETLIFTF